MNKKNNKNEKNKIKFYDKEGDEKIIYEVEKKAEQQTVTSDKKSRQRVFKNVRNNWFYSSAEWKKDNNSEFEKIRQYHLGFWATGVVIFILIAGGIFAWVKSRNKKKSLDEEKFL